MPFCGPHRTALPIRLPPALFLELQNEVECSRNDAKSIYERFRKLAPSGYLTLSKFQECLGLLGTLGKLFSESMFIAFDRNGDGYLDFVEYARAVLTMLNGSELHRMELSYRIVRTTSSYECCGHHRGAVYASGKVKEEIGKGCIDMEGFQTLVKDITATRNVLIGQEFNYYTPEYVAEIFTNHASLCDDGVKRISQHDFNRAVHCSREFVELLGAPGSHCAVEASLVTPGAAKLPPCIQGGCLTKMGSDDTIGRKGKTYINRTNALRQRQSTRTAVHTLNRRGGGLAQRVSSRRGLAVYFGHERWNDVINMMIGLGLSARRVYREITDTIALSDFREKRIFSISPNAMLGVEPSLNFVEQEADACNFKGDPHKVIFTEHAPLIFKRLRRLMNLSEEEYIQSVGPEHLVGNMVLGNISTLSELVSEGKSGALFYFTANGRLVLKTVTPKCAEFVQEWLPSYYEHVRKHPNTLITRFVGLFSMTQSKDRGVPTYFMVMNNVFYSSVAIHRRYDLKGSWVGRSVPLYERKDHTVALKDCDMVELKEFLELGEDVSAGFFEALQHDVEFLSRSMLLDYSLLLGIHYRSMSEDDVDWDNRVDQQQASCLMARGRDRLYFLGIIDVLTPWNFVKRAESAWRRIQTLNSPGVSCINPQQYGQRFMKFIKNRTQ
ncbi:putative 1-phosphatidylinositol-4-phosphate 5-kinase [Babesia divergens]|uniref:1-phosphatidylinositol-4-phosphate 5-kinase n=1 Tax=Babesia divergens TaxID=32595 RepID=A0AAD9LI99_BABDI|nr:putative 1-phosphatidylinositol-4-phosphate 5-kinase [Babesia divergens]